MRKDQVIPLAIAVAIAIAVLPATSRAQISAGHVNNFEDGTTQGWRINPLNMGSPPPASLPGNIASGGPAGVNDNYLRLTSLGGMGAGSRMVVTNDAGWRGNYIAAGIESIRMDAINLGSTDLALRFFIEDPTTGPPVNIAMSAEPQILAAGSGWQTLEFPLYGATGLAALLGDVNAALSATTVVRILHSDTFNYPPESIAAQLGVDNITANVSMSATVVPEPATVAMMAIGLLVLGAVGFRNRF